MGRAGRAAAIIAVFCAGACRGDDLLVGIADPQQGAAAPAQPEGALAEPGLDPTGTFGFDGIPGPLAGVYTDLGLAHPDAAIRGLVSFPIRDRERLEQTIRDIYDPSSPEYRRYLTPEEWIARHAPREDDVQTVIRWMTDQGLEVPRIATNRLLIQFTGTVREFNQAFGTELRVLLRKSPQQGNPPHEVYGLTEEITVPQFVRERIHAVVAADLAAETDPLPPESGTVSALPSPLEDGLTPAQVMRAYGVDELHARGFRGGGVKLGVTIGASFRRRDLQGFWSAFGISRALPTVVQTMEPPSTRYREGTLDVEWAGVIAPEADLIVYMGPDARNTSMIYTFNEAISRGEVSVISDSFAHRDDSEPRPVHEAYDASAAMSAALGITVVAASGDSGGADVPSTSPYVTGVGGTFLRMSGMTVLEETAWPHSGCGLSRTFPRPDWQSGISAPGDKRAVADVSLNAAMGYWYLWLGEWHPNIGTSFGTPVFAGLLAVVNDARAAQGKPRLGWINKELYTNGAVQASFRDITDWVSLTNGPAGPGWDFPTGWGAPNAPRLLDSLP